MKTSWLAAGAVVIVLFLKAQTSGSLDRFHVTKGDRTSLGEPIVSLDLGGRKTY